MRVLQLLTISSLKASGNTATANTQGVQSMIIASDKDPGVAAAQTDDKRNTQPVRTIRQSTSDSPVT